MKRYQSIIYSIIVVCLFPLLCSFQINYQAMRQAGMGNVGTGWILDASSAFYNPSALALQYNNNIQIGGCAIQRYVAFQAQYPNAYSTLMNPSLLTPVYGYASLHITRHSPFAFGLAVNTPFQTNVQWESDWKGRFIVQNHGISTLAIQPTFSFRFNEHFSIGVAPVFCLSGYVHSQSIQILAPQSIDGSMEFAAQGRGWGANVGIMYRPNERFSVGASYRSAIDMQYKKGQLTFNVPATAKNYYPNQSIATHFRLPSVASIGFVYRPHNKILVAADVNYIGWQVFDSLNIAYSTKDENYKGYREVMNFRNSYAVKFGIEFMPTHFFSLRFGSHYELSPVRDEYVSPAYPDANKIGLTTGVGIVLGQKIYIDIAGGYAFTGDRTALYKQAAFAGVYKANAYMGGIGVRYAF